VPREVESSPSDRGPPRAPISLKSLENKQVFAGDNM
jgi:hypothetical protein